MHGVNVTMVFVAQSCCQNLQTAIYTFSGVLRQGPREVRSPGITRSVSTYADPRTTLKGGGSIHAPVISRKS